MSTGGGAVALLKRQWHACGGDGDGEGDCPGCDGAGLASPPGGSGGDGGCGGFCAATAVTATSSETASSQRRRQCAMLTVLPPTAPARYSSAGHRYPVCHDVAAQFNCTLHTGVAGQRHGSAFTLGSLAPGCTDSAMHAEGTQHCRATKAPRLTASSSFRLLELQPLSS